MLFICSCRRVCRRRVGLSEFGCVLFRQRLRARGVPKEGGRCFPQLICLQWVEKHGMTVVRNSQVKLPKRRRLVAVKMAANGSFEWGFWASTGTRANMDSDSRFTSASGLSRSVRGSACTHPASFFDDRLSHHLRRLRILAAERPARIGVAGSSETRTASVLTSHVHCRTQAESRSAAEQPSMATRGQVSAHPSASEV
jgi:hypothetical protein